MRISVVINTYNRAPSLRRTLESLRQQTYADFEVIVVNGPSTDDTVTVLAEFDGMIRIADCPDVHLSKSRNIGIEAAAGDVVAFIDDDAIPEPDWLATLATAYVDPTIHGAGGLVYDHTGVRLQYAYSVCDRLGFPDFTQEPPFDAASRPGADPFLYLQGTNCSFRREALVAVGGFDEEIEYYLDETEVCLRMIDHGFRLTTMTGAAVHHKYLPSHVRNHRRRVLDPYSMTKNQCYFALQNGRRSRPTREVLAELSRYLDERRREARTGVEIGELTQAQYDHFLRRLDEGVEVGVDRGMRWERRVRQFGPCPEREFLPFPICRPDGERLNVCFLTNEYPPGDFGGIGRLYHDLAVGYAQRGHEVHVITVSPDEERVDLEAGVWVHRVRADEVSAPTLQGLPLEENLKLIARFHHEVDRLHRRRRVDLVSAPLWLCQGMMCEIAARVPVVTTLHTTMKTIAELDPAWMESIHTRHLTALEDETLRMARHVVANSQAMLAKVRQEVGSIGSARTIVIPHGTADVAERFPPRREADERVRVLFVGRLEERKGVDLLLKAARTIASSRDDVEFVLVGKDNPNPVTGHSYADDHREMVTQMPVLADRVRLAGAVTEDELFQHYADCDLFVLPSRFESFGLVLTEAMMFGKPVIAADSGGMPEIVEDHENGRVFRSGDADDLCRVLRELIDDADQRHRFGHRSRELFETKFTREIMIDATIEAHREIVRATRSVGTSSTDLAQVIERVSEQDVLRSARIATELFGPLRSERASDPAQELADAWHLPAREFVQRAYLVILHRTADESGVDWYRNQLNHGLSRLDLVRALATSPEAQYRRHDPSWLDHFRPPSEPTETVTPTLAIPRTMPLRVRSRLARLPVVGKVLRYVKRWIALPVTMQRVYARTIEAERTSAERYRILESELNSLKETLHETRPSTEIIRWFDRAA